MFNEVLDIADQHGRQQIVGNGDQHDHKDSCELEAIGFRISQQALDDHRIRHIAVELLHSLVPLNLDIGNQEGDGKDANNGTHNENGQILIHCDARLLPLPASAAPPSCGIPRRWHRARHGFRKQRPCRHR